MDFTHEDTAISRRGNQEYHVVQVDKSGRFAGCGAQDEGLDEQSKLQVNICVSYLLRLG
jgi:hypothetical protein